MTLSNKIAMWLVSVFAVGLIATYGLAQGKPGPAPRHGMMGADAGAAHVHPCMHDGMHCPMHDLASLVEVKMEKTKTGATLQLIAKDPAKLVEVQALAERMSEHMKAGGCPMMKDRGPMHGHHHDKPLTK